MLPSQKSDRFGLAPRDALWKTRSCYRITSTPRGFPGHVSWPAEHGTRERMLKIPAKGLSMKHMVVTG